MRIIKLTSDIQPKWRGGPDSAFPGCPSTSSSGATTGRSHSSRRRTTASRTKSSRRWAGQRVRPSMEDRRVQQRTNQPEKAGVLLDGNGTPTPRRSPRGRYTPPFLSALPPCAHACLRSGSRSCPILDETRQPQQVRQSAIVSSSLNDNHGRVQQGREKKGRER